MRHDDLDHILSEGQEILPSSGFVGSVMDAVRYEAAGPPPIPFPWKRALPGFAAAAFAFVSVVVSFVEFFRAPTPQPPPSLPPAVDWILHVAKTSGAGWILLALLLTLVSVMFSMLAARRIRYSITS